ncbi:polyprenyl synthetase family protein [Nesterenkonia marinintestina]|uniref:polyprenyl synthetase family protein n=1 Tax=Nesterenkonia marinintestina TaxID=2979865 RepID=UPI0021C1B584|nr:polyprenyl synthetase family protein [Nesterenkonia sp. GX14115]
MEIEEFIVAVEDACRGFLSDRRSEVGDISPDAVPLVDQLGDMLEGGKRLRPVLAWIGWRSAAEDPGHPAVMHSGTALELFQAAALIHDDVVDRSDHRRGHPSFHRSMAARHRESGFSGDAEHFGTSSAILAGDLALSWAGEAFDRAAESTGTDSSAARAVFRTMHTQVITGQYLDVRAEIAPARTTEEDAVAAARTVLRHKAAKYSTEHPVVLGAALAGAEEPLRRAWARSALPLGEAFQLRDDLLGVFGDPASTGKPVGDDLREGKRTELVAYGLFRAPRGQAEELESMLGDPRLDEEDVARARRILQESGAVDEVERSIDALVAESDRRLDDVVGLGVASDVVEDYRTVADRLVRRVR